MIVERRVVLHEQSALASAAHNPQVAQSVLGDLLHGYFVLTGWVLGVALVVLVIAVLAGPYRWAVAFRSRVTRTWRSIRRPGAVPAGASWSPRWLLARLAFSWRAPSPPGSCS